MNRRPPFSFRSPRPGGRDPARGLHHPLGTALACYDTMRRPRGTADLIQAQRDVFGAHGFKRLDMDGDYHGPWAMNAS